jgi:hypothetical protein
MTYQRKPVTAKVNITQRQANKAVGQYLRPKPYTKAGLRRMPCAHCAKPAARQWSLRPCAIGRMGWYPLCINCDLALNEIVMDFLNVPDRVERLAAYRDADSDVAA